MHDGDAGARVARRHVGRHDGGDDAAVRRADDPAVQRGLDAAAASRAVPAVPVAVFTAGVPARVDALRGARGGRAVGAPPARCCSRPRWRARVRRSRAGCSSRPGSTSGCRSSARASRIAARRSASSRRSGAKAWGSALMGDAARQLLRRVLLAADGVAVRRRSDESAVGGGDRGVRAGGEAGAGGAWVGRGRRGDGALGAWVRPSGSEWLPGRSG